MSQPGLLSKNQVGFRVAIRSDGGLPGITTMKCPDCRAQTFYVKDPDDQYEISEFDVKEGVVNYSSVNIESDPLPIDDDIETFCDRCAWHGKFKILKQGR